MLTNRAAIAATIATSTRLIAFMSPILYGCVVVVLMTQSGAVRALSARRHPRRRLVGRKR